MTGEGVNDVLPDMAEAAGTGTIRIPALVDRTETGIEAFVAANNTVVETNVFAVVGYTISCTTP